MSEPTGIERWMAGAAVLVIDHCDHALSLGAKYGLEKAIAERCVVAYAAGQQSQSSELSRLRAQLTEAQEVGGELLKEKIEGTVNPWRAIASEREACAQVAEEHSVLSGDEPELFYLAAATMALTIAKAIRARQAEGAQSKA